MVRFFRGIFQNRAEHSPVLILAISVLSGYITGCHLAYLSGTEHFFMLRSFAGEQVSLIGICISLFLPFLLTVFAVSVSQPVILLPVAFFKALAFSYLSCGLMLISGSSGWLYRSLFLFSDCLSFPVLCWLWMRCMVSFRTDCALYCFAAAAVLLLIGAVDFRYISPFLSGLLS